MRAELAGASPPYQHSTTGRLALPDSPVPELGGDTDHEAAWAREEQQVRARLGAVLGLQILTGMTVDDTGAGPDDGLDCRDAEHAGAAGRAHGPGDWRAGRVRGSFWWSRLFAEHDSGVYRMLEDLEGSVDRTESKLGSAVYRMRQLVRDTEEKRSGLCIGILVVVLVLLLLAVILV
jgi:hypothetical protein